MEDIRWKQRFSNYQKALQRLKDNIEYFSTFLAENITAVNCVVVIQKLAQKYSWFSTCVKEVRMFRIEENTDLLPALSI